MSLFTGKRVRRGGRRGGWTGSFRVPYPFPVYTCNGGSRRFALLMIFNLLWVQVSIRNANVHDSRFNKGLYIKYKPFKETEFTTTKTVKDTLSPEFDEKDSKVFGFDSVKQELLDWFDSGCITFQLMGRQEDSDPDSSRKRMTTKVCVTRSFGASHFGGLRDVLRHPLRHARMAYFA